MKKFSIIISASLLLISLTTFNPKNLNFNFNFFKIKLIEVNNVQILDKKEITALFYDQLYGSNLLVLNKNKIYKILNKNELLDYVEFKKIYPSKLQIIVFEKEVVAIINNKRNKFYLTKNGEKIKYFNNKKLKNLPNIFGKQKNFLDLYITLNQLNFPTSKIKSFYYFEIGRWDIVLKNNVIIKLPVKNFKDSLKNYLVLKEKINFENYSIFDYRIKDQLILN